MEISEVNNKRIFELVVRELRDMGVKYVRAKKGKVTQEECPGRIFHAFLHTLEFTEVFLANGNVVQIPKFVADACSRILEQVNIEGIFRKAGSSKRQKEIRLSLENGLPLGKNHHVIDIANVVKYFFRELPEPLISLPIQDMFLRSLQIKANYKKSILLTCLLLPSLEINTLAFFMQFLLTVSLSSQLNKMSVDNLAIIFTPGLMPFSNVKSQRFNNHVKIVKLLIENANAIGTLPKTLLEKLQNCDPTPKLSTKRLSGLDFTQKKKKRHSEMLSNLKKIIGSAVGSSENLENDLETNTGLPLDDRQLKLHVTPCGLQSVKKPKSTEAVYAMSSKKKNTKNSRISLGGLRLRQNSVANSQPASTERRWSIIGSGWSKQKKKNFVEMNKCENNDIAKQEVIVKQNSISQCSEKDNEQQNEQNDCKKESNEEENTKEEFIQIEENVVAIKTCILKQFDKKPCSLMETVVTSNSKALGDAEHLNIKYEGVLFNNDDVLCTPIVDHLSHRLNRELKIPRSADHRTLRSPSARKRRTICQRSQDKVRVTRNQTWLIKTQNTSRTSHENHISDTTQPHCEVSTGLFSQPSLAIETNWSVPYGIDQTWTAGEAFFSNGYNTKKGNILNLNNFETPKAPSKFANRNRVDGTLFSTPVVPGKPSNVETSTSRKRFLDEEANCRASIAHLRAHNAGKVMATARLFDGLTSISSQNEV